MKAAELISLASTARGIDLKHVAGNASNVHGVARTRRLTALQIRLCDELKISREVAPTVQGAGSHVYRRPMWTAAELGQAAQGLERMPWLASRYSFAGDSSGYPELHRGLMMEALRMATVEKWPMQVPGRDGSMQYYIAELASLVLDAERDKWMFVKVPGLYADCMHMADEIYATKMAHRYTSLQLRYEGWLNAAESWIQRKLRNDPEQDAPAVQADAEEGVVYYSTTVTFLGVQGTSGLFRISEAGKPMRQVTANPFTSFHLQLQKAS
ncbi:MAG TPA: hypothetical protein VI653_21015 [Steroidobacteraceae bacterium]